MTDAMDLLTGWGTAAAAIIALIVGVISLIFASQAKKSAREANQIADTANGIASAANTVAEAANRITTLQAERSVERSDVAWECFYDEDRPQYLRVQNIGKNQALRVVAQVFFDGETESNDVNPEDLEGRGSMRIEVPGLAEARYAAYEEIEVSRLTQTTPDLSEHRLRLRVSWNTPLGVAKFYDSGVSVLPVTPFASP
ncbi:hypothetical protein [Agreia sp. COWG]|uniref:hypothetical protein n=1 Tax=Agreia sp. COWG TaxID=2773266 RepID=UPI0019275354|nr:hypothetical protein [Agreia sp. COWG]CAD6015785.1 conserved protein of unknown function [Agreia sp. COWG]